MYMSVYSPYLLYNLYIYIYDVLYVCICPSIDACWYGWVNLIFKICVRTDAGPVMECQCTPGALTPRRPELFRSVAKAVTLAFWDR
jgi:hypothetical protein